MWMTRSRKIVTMANSASESQTHEEKLDSSGGIRAREDKLGAAQDYPSFQDITRAAQAQTQQQYAEVPEQLAPLFAQLFKNDEGIAATVTDLRHSVRTSFAAIHDDFRAVVAELERIRAELRLAHSGGGQAAPQQPLDPTLPRQGFSDTYQSAFRT